MKIHLCGTRGSTQAPGADFVRYGGHTSCVALARDGQPVTLILDAGTGIRRVTGLLDGRAFDGAILLGHLHWDHTHGLPFFRAGDDDRARVAVHLPAQDDADPEQLLERGFSPPHFPIKPSQLRGDWSFNALEERQHTIAGWQVLAREIPHKGGRTFGYRISDGTTAMAYLSDHHPAQLGPGPDGFGPYHPAALELADGADVLLHDAQYLPSEWPERGSFGHSTPGYAVGLGIAAGVTQVVLFHHDPARTDDQIDALIAAHQHPDVTVIAARDGQTLTLGAGRHTTTP